MEDYRAVTREERVPTSPLPAVAPSHTRRLGSDTGAHLDRARPQLRRQVRTGRKAPDHALAPHAEHADDAGMDQATESAMALMQVRISMLERRVAFLLKAAGATYTEPISPQLAPVAALLCEGRRKDAIDLYCEKTGESLASAQAAIFELSTILGASR